MVETGTTTSNRSYFFVAIIGGALPGVEITDTFCGHFRGRRLRPDGVLVDAVCFALLSGLTFPASWSFFKFISVKICCCRLVLGPSPATGAATETGAVGTDIFFVSATATGVAFDDNDDAFDWDWWDRIDEKSIIAVADGLALLLLLFSSLFSLIELVSMFCCCSWTTTFWHAAVRALLLFGFGWGFLFLGSSSSLSSLLDEDEEDDSSNKWICWVFFSFFEDLLLFSLFSCVFFSKWLFAGGGKLDFVFFLVLVALVLSGASAMSVKSVE